MKEHYERVFKFWLGMAFLSLVNHFSFRIGEVLAIAWKAIR